MSLIQVVVGGASKDLYVMMLEKAYSELNERFSYDIFLQKEKICSFAWEKDFLRIKCFYCCRDYYKISMQSTVVSEAPRDNIQSTDMRCLVSDFHLYKICSQHVMNLICFAISFTLISFFLFLRFVLTQHNSHTHEGKSL